MSVLVTPGSAFCTWRAVCIGLGWSVSRTGVLIPLLPWAESLCTWLPAGEQGFGADVVGSPKETPLKPMDAFTGSGLKRKFDDVDVGSSVSNSDDEISSSDSADSCGSLNPPTSASASHVSEQLPVACSPVLSLMEPFAALTTASVQLGDLSLVVISPTLSSVVLFGGPHCSNIIDLSGIYSS